MLQESDTPCSMATNKSAPVTYKNRICNINSSVPLPRMFTFVNPSVYYSPSIHNLLAYNFYALYNSPTNVFIWFRSIETRFIISILRLNCIECPQYVARTARAEAVVVKLTTLKVSDN